VLINPLAFIKLSPGGNYVESHACTASRRALACKRCHRVASYLQSSKKKKDKEEYKPRFYKLLK